MKWFRFYSEVLHDSKVQTIAPELFRAWVNLLCLANESPERGRLPDLKQVAFSLRVREDRAAKMLEDLVEIGLLDRVAGVLQPHNWNGRQHGSDDVNTRVKKHRKKKAEAEAETLSETLHETGTERDCNAAYPDTDTETENTPPTAPPRGAPAAAVASPPSGNGPGPGDPFAAMVERSRAELGEWATTFLLTHRADIDRSLGGRADFYLAGLHAAAAAKDTIRDPHAYAMKTAKRYLDEGVTDPPIPHRAGKDGSPPVRF